MRFSLLIITALFFTPFYASSQYYFHNYRNENGLSNNTVLCSIQDSRGFIWLGTRDGLNRFDGYVFKTYMHNQNDSNSIINNHISALDEDNDNCIWIGTLDGVCAYNINNDCFEKIQSEDYTISGRVRDVKVDLQNNIWIANEKGIYRYNKSTRNLSYYSSYDYFPPHEICIKCSGNIWFSSNNGKVYEYDPQTDNFIAFDVLTESELEISVSIENIIDIGDEGLLITTNKLGARRLDTNTGKIYRLFEKDANGNEILINSVLKKNKNEIWIGSETGIHIYDLQRGFIANIKKSNNDPYSISNNAIKSFTADLEGGIWIGTYYGGVNYIKNENTPFHKYYSTGESGSLKGNVVRAIAADTYGNLWIGTEDAGLSKLNFQTNQFKNFITNANSDIKSSDIYNLLVDQDLLWIGSFDAGIYVLDIKSEKVIKHYSQSSNDGLQTNFIVTFLKTSDGEIFVGTNIGLYQYDKNNDKLVYINNVASQSFIYDLHEDQDGKIWISTNSGIFCYNRASNVVKHLYHDPKDHLSLSSNRVTSIFEDKDNQLWFTTQGDGFCKLDKSSGNFERYFIKKELNSNISCGILQDGTGLMWIATTNGLMTFREATGEMQVYKKENGLVDNQFSYNSTYMDNNGKMYFGTVNGFISFHPSDFERNKYNPPVYITDFRVQGADKISLPIKRNIDESALDFGEIKLKHDDSSFRIEFVAPSFSNPKMTKYRYMLEGYDKNWVELPGNRSIYYNNVHPGTYKFRVTTMNPDHEWNDNESVLTVKIIPAFWASNVAYIIYLLLLLTISYIIYKEISIRRHLAQKRKMDELANEKDKEVLNAKINFFTNITHEVRTPLTLIKAPLDKMLGTKNNSEFMLKNLSIMKKNTDRLLELTNQLLDFRKVEKEGVKLEFKRVDVCKLIETTSSRFIPNAAQKNISFNIHIPVESYYAILDQETLIKVLSNLFSNALKFALNKIDVYLEPDAPDEKTLRVRVTSDGNLIPKKFAEEIFEPFYQIENAVHKTNPIQGTGLGLSLARSLAELHFGKLYFDTNVTDLNSFVLELPKSQKISVVHEKDKVVINEDADEYLKESDDLTEDSKCDMRPTLLIVEDEIEMCDYLAEEFSSIYKTIKAYNGSDAVKILENNHVNVVVSDVVMPLMDGYELCNFIKKNLEYSHIPIILLTSSINTHAKIAGLESGADAYVEKPIDFELLYAQISNLFMNRELANENFLSTPLTHYKTIAVNKMDEDFMKQLHSNITKHIHEPELNVEKVAKLMNISISTLYRKVKAITKLNTNEYIRLYRLKKAAELLTTNEYRISEVSYLVGFSAPSYFATSFQKQFGMSPSEFIKQQTKILQVDIK